MKEIGRDTRSCTLAYLVDFWAKQMWFHGKALDGLTCRNMKNRLGMKIGPFDLEDSYMFIPGQ